MTTTCGDVNQHDVGNYNKMSSIGQYTDSILLDSINIESNLSAISIQSDQERQASLIERRQRLVTWAPQKSGDLYYSISHWNEQHAATTG